MAPPPWCSGSARSAGCCCALRAVGRQQDASFDMVRRAHASLSTPAHGGPEMARFSTTPEELANSIAYPISTSATPSFTGTSGELTGDAARV